MTATSTLMAATATASLPGGLELAASMSPWLQALILALGTLILEDTTAIAAGLLAHDGTIGLPTAILGTGVGIFVGDLGLYGLGAAAARGARGTRWIRHRLPADRVARISRWFGDSGWKAIVFSRFVSGSRLPIYLGAGFVGAGFRRFALFTFIAVAVWTPLVVGATALAGASLITVAEQTLGGHWFAWVAVAIAAVAMLHVAIALIARPRATWLALLRASRFEFWPAWLVYAPMLPFFLWHLPRYGFARTLTAVNPCWPDSGAVGESKKAGLDAFDDRFVAPSFIFDASNGPLDSATIDAACARLQSTGWTERDASTGAWNHPVIVKPDTGYRGLAVRVVRSEADFRALLAQSRVTLLIQRFEDGACEVGLFFIRDPGTDGRLYSICDKRFPHVVGDGRSTLRQLIARDARLRLQEDVFFARFEARLGEIPANGSRLRMGNAGNHMQGCLFVDGEHLRTDALEAWVRNACRDAKGFNYGRLDVRFPSADHCRRGEGGVILEANGITSESTNMYDPEFGALRAWRIMFGHWGAALRIGFANRASGVAGVSLRRVLGTRRRTGASHEGLGIAD